VCGGGEFISILFIHFDSIVSGFVIQLLDPVEMFIFLNFSAVMIVDIIALRKISWSYKLNESTLIEYSRRVLSKHSHLVQLFNNKS